MSYLLLNSYDSVTAFPRTLVGWEGGGIWAADSLRKII